MRYSTINVLFKTKYYMKIARAENITNSRVGERFTDAMAIGLIDFFKAHPEMPVPTTGKEFEKGIVSMARSSGDDGLLAFSYSRRAKMELYALFGTDPENPELEVRDKLKLIGDKTLSNKERADVIRSFGEEFELLARAFEAGDCQRPLVFQRFFEIIKEDNLK